MRSQQSRQDIKVIDSCIRANYGVKCPMNKSYRYGCRLIAAILLTSTSFLAAPARAKKQFQSYSTNPVSPTTATYDAGSPSQTYTFGNGSDEELASITAGGTNYTPKQLANEVFIRRADNSLVTGERCNIFIERSTTGTGDVNSGPTYPVDTNGDCSLSEVLKGLIVNRGVLDILSNDSSGSAEEPNNVERVDFVYTAGIVAPTNASDLNEAGHVVMEKNGNNPVKLAAILSIDAAGNPTSFSNTVVTVSSSDYGNTGGGISNNFLFDPSTSGPVQNPEFDEFKSEPVGGTLVTLSDLGITAGQTYYGFAVFGTDVNPSNPSSDLIDWTNQTVFPRDTQHGSGQTGGADWQGGMAGYWTSFALPDNDFGDAPVSYDDTAGGGSINASDNPARHGIANTLYFGSTSSGVPDDETAPQSSIAADGDDDTGTDDENGVDTFPTLNAGSTSYSLDVTVNNTTTSAANVYGWIDFDRDGEFDEDERAAAATVAANSTNATVTLNWPSIGGAGADISAGDSYLRIRVATNDLDNSTETTGRDDASVGAASDGEVEDYQVAIAAAAPPSPPTGPTCVSPSTATFNTVPYTLGSEIQNSLPLTFYGGSMTLNATLNGSTTFTGTDGIQVQTDISFGDHLFVQPTTLPNYLTSGNNATYVFTFPAGAEDFSMVAGGLNNDDGITILAEFQGSSVPISAANFSNLSAGMTLRDADGDGASETVVSTSSSGGFEVTSNTYLFNIAGPIDKLTVVTGKEDASNGNVTLGFLGIGFCGVAPDTDYGDAPVSYDDTAGGGTIDASDTPAEHAIANALKLGNEAPDNESAPQSSTDADGDDDATAPNVDDEDGIADFPAIAADTTSYSLDLTVNNGSGSAANVYAWIDFDGDGEFDEDERATVADGTDGSAITLNGSGQVPAGLNGTVTLEWTGIGTANDITAGDSFVRVRVTTDALAAAGTAATRDAASVGSASDGEVEDFSLAIAAAANDCSASGTADASISPFISAEVEGGSSASRTAVDGLDDSWRTAAGLPQTGTVQPWFGTTTGALSNNESSLFSVGGVNVGVALVNMDVASDCDGTINANGAPELSNSNTLQGSAPRPASLYNTSNQPSFWNETPGDGNNSSRNAVLFTFDQPVSAFGAWFGDLETRTIGGTAATLRLLDASGNRIGSDIDIEPTTLINGTTTTSVNQSQCGNTGTNTGCGNSSTRWVGFVDSSATARVKQVLVIVGDDDFGDSGNSEHISFIGLNLATASNPELKLVKRITAVNGVDLPGFDGNDGRTEDEDPNWPAPASTYLRGAVSSGIVGPGDTVEFTIYYLSSGDDPLTNLSICDLVPDNMTFDIDAFNGLTPLDSGSSTGTYVGIALGSDDTSLPSSPSVFLTNTADGDRGQFYLPNTSAPGTCNIADTSAPLPAGSNLKGAVVVDVVQSPTTLPNATTPGTPTESYGFIRFRAIVD